MCSAFVLFISAAVTMSSSQLFNFIEECTYLWKLFYDFCLLKNLLLLNTKNKILSQKWLLFIFIITTIITRQLRNQTTCPTKLSTSTWKATLNTKKCFFGCFLASSAVLSATRINWNRRKCFLAPLCEAKIIPNWTLWLNWK